MTDTTEEEREVAEKFLEEFNQLCMKYKVIHSIAKESLAMTFFKAS